MYIKNSKQAQQPMGGASYQHSGLVSKTQTTSSQQNLTQYQMQQQQQQLSKEQQIYLMKKMQ